MNRQARIVWPIATEWIDKGNTTHQEAALSMLKIYSKTGRLESVPSVVIETVDEGHPAGIQTFRCKAEMVYTATPVRNDGDRNKGGWDTSSQASHD